MFYTNRLNESVSTDVVYFDEAEIKESIYNDFEEGALNAMAENEANYNKLIESIGMMESAMFDETGDVVYTEGMISSVWENLKKFVIKVWQKIVALFKRFIAMFDQYFANDKNFLKKYRARIMQSDAKDLDVNGYTFKDLESKASGAKLDSFKVDANLADEGTTRHDAYKTDKEAGDQLDAVIDGFRADMVGKTNGKVDSSEFADELKEYYYGSTSPESLDNIDLGEQVRIIDGTKDAVKEYNKLKNEVDKAFKRVIKELEDKKGEKAKAAGAAEGADKNAEGDFAKKRSHAVSVLHQECGVVTQTIGVILNAFKDRNRQARSICVKAIAKSGKFNNESAGFEYPEYGTNFLSDIQFK